MNGQEGSISFASAMRIEYKVAVIESQNSRLGGAFQAILKVPRSIGRLSGTWQWLAHLRWADGGVDLRLGGADRSVTAFLALRSLRSANATSLPSNSDIRTCSFACFANPIQGGRKERGLGCRSRKVQHRLNLKLGITPRGMSRLLRAFPSLLTRPLSHKVDHTSIAAPHSVLPPRSIFSPSTRATTARMASTKPFSEAVKARRTYYALDSSSPIPDARIQEVVSHAILHVPSAFNSQTSRVVILLNDEHKKCWDLIAEIYKQQLSAEKFEHANQRFQGFRKGYGTVSVSVVWCCMGSFDGGGLGKRRGREAQEHALTKVVMARFCSMRIPIV